MKTKIATVLLSFLLILTLFSVPASANSPFTLDRPENLTVSLLYDSDGVPYFELKLEVPDKIIEIEDALLEDPEYFGVHCDEIEIVFDIKYKDYDWNEGPSPYWNTSDYLSSFLERGGYWEYHPFDEIPAYDILSEHYTFRAHFFALWGETEDLVNNELYSNYSDIASISNTDKSKPPTITPTLIVKPTATPTPTPTPTNPSNTISSRYDVFAKFDGITGESASSKYKSHMDILSFRFSGYNVTGGNKSANKAYFNQIKIVKAVDSASPKLVDYMNNGTHLKSVTFIFDKVDRFDIPTLKLELKDVIISHYKLNTNEEGRLVEEIGLSFIKADYEYSQLAQDGTVKSTNSAQFDYKAKDSILKAASTDSSFDEPITANAPKSIDYDIFAKIDSIQGESTAYAYKNVIEIQSLSFEGHNSAKPGVTSAGKAEFETVKIVKGIDLSSSKLLNTMATGKHIKDVVFYYQKVSKSGVSVLKITLRDLVITSYQLCVDSEGRLVEEIGINFYSQAEYEYTKLDQSGNTVKSIKTTIDLVK